MVSVALVRSMPSSPAPSFRTAGAGRKCELAMQEAFEKLSNKAAAASRRPVAVDLKSPERQHDLSPRVGDRARFGVDQSLERPPHGWRERQEVAASRQCHRQFARRRPAIERRRTRPWIFNLDGDLDRTACGRSVHSDQQLLPAAL